MNLSGGPFTYNRFDKFEKSLSEKLDPVGKEDADVNNDGKTDSTDSYLKNRRDAIGKAMGSADKQTNKKAVKKEEVELEEGKGASSPAKMKKKVDKAAKKSKGAGLAYRDEDEKEEGKEEVNTAEGGDGGGAMGEEVVYENRRAARAAGGYKDDSKKQTDPSKEGFTGISGSIEEIMKQNAKIKARGGPPGKKMEEANGNLAQRGVKKLNNDSKANAEAKIMEGNEQRMAMYSRALGVMGAHYSGTPMVEKKDDEPTAERKAAADRADEEKRQKKEGKKGEAHETKEIEKMEDKELSKEEFSLTKEMVIEYMVQEGFANNEVSAEILHTHMSDELLASIESQMLEG